MKRVALEANILNIIERAREPLLISDIKTNRRLRKEKKKNIKMILNSLIKRKKIESSENGYYWAQKNKKIIHARVTKINKTFGFVREVYTQKEVFIPGGYMLGALPGDKVIIKTAASKSGTLLEGRILVIEEFGKGEYIGKIIDLDGKYFFTSYNMNFPLELKIDQPFLEIYEGMLVRVKIIYRGKDNCEHIAKIEEIMGDTEKPETCCNLILAQNHIRKNFDKQTSKLANILAKKQISEKEYNERLDLRKEMIFTIDGEDSKDLDDAISLKKEENGFWELGVHIADVSYYVKSGSSLDRQAYERGTSIYYADSVIPMLPKDLSNGICSLNQGEERLAFSVIIKLDDNGRIISYVFKKSVIKSKIKGIYQEINKILENEATEQINEKYKEVKENIFLMEQLAELLRKKGLKEGV